jgi:hypothetical protein
MSYIRLEWHQRAGALLTGVSHFREGGYVLKPRVAYLATVGIVVSPKGICPSAQGCAVLRYPGKDRAEFPNPNGVASLRVQPDRYC